MGIKLSVRRLLWAAFVVVLLTVGALLAIDLHIVDWAFGSGTTFYDRLHNVVRFLRDNYGANRANIELALKVIGFAFTILFGVVAALTALHYAQANMPQRLQEYADHVRHDHIEDRAVFIVSRVARNLRGDMTPAAPIGHLRGLAMRFRSSPFEKSLSKLMGQDSLETLDNDIKVLSARLGLCKAERITAHLVAGLRFAAEARLLEDGTTAQVTKSEAALEQYRKALKLDANDLDALEQVVKQSRTLNLNVDHALSRLEQSARAQSKPTRLARALRFQAEVMEDFGTRTGREEARDKLDFALETLSDAIAGPEKSLELALIHEQLGALHYKRGTPTLVAEHLDAAAELFRSIPPPEGSAGERRIEALRSQQIVPKSPTHICLQSMSVFEEPDQDSAVVDELPAFSAVSAAIAADGWSLVARGGKKLGFAKAANLQELR